MDSAVHDVQPRVNSFRAQVEELREVNQLNTTPTAKDSYDMSISTTRSVAYFDWPSEPV